jgi:hypothetical protein
MKPSFPTTQVNKFSPGGKWPTVEPEYEFDMILNPDSVYTVLQRCMGVTLPGGCFNWLLRKKQAKNKIRDVLKSR